ncbi:peptidoglycan editing factor PgeF [Asticcacaulis machinosus]|uniref:Purine nucleoside phosphorylase n=1 Tax=Asticcacaulis machinosus TaxID=2984211 RepID=A0ABT5HG31_9CAUL|nr:peptidoglycan editing factor PgeF [Asticcacaulis machinosus]MDC7675041.1 peptidoglycan editing factor PgeF [Asticcacaulis machinosus]
MTSIPPRMLHPLLDLPGIQHGFFTRLGGVSQAPYDSLNIGLGSSDDQASVRENRRRVAASFDRDENHLLTCYQVHSAIALTINMPFLHDARPEADGLVTGKAGLVLGALSADCAPLLFADPINRVVASAHAGWKGALGGIIEATLNAMLTQGADLRHIRCVVGPCIQQASYEVSADYEATFAETDPDSPAFFIPGASPDKRFFDLPGYCLMRLKRFGVTMTASTDHDTCAQGELFFSNRRAFKTGESDYGRLISAIMLRPE